MQPAGKTLLHESVPAAESQTSLSLFVTVFMLQTTLCTTQPWYRSRAKIAEYSKSNQICIIGRVECMPAMRKGWGLYSTWIHVVCSKSLIALCKTDGGFLPEHFGYFSCFWDWSCWYQRIVSTLACSFRELRWNFILAQETKSNEKVRGQAE